MDNHNRRRHVRIEFQAMAELRFADRTFARHETRDLSLKSVFVLGVEGPGLGDHCELTLHLAGGSSSVRLIMQAEVVRLEPGGLALRFSEIDLDSFIHLKNIVSYNVDDPDVLEQEWLASFSHGQK